MSPPAMSGAHDGGTDCVFHPIVPRGCGWMPAAAPAQLPRCCCPAPGQGDSAPTLVSPGPPSPSPGHRQRWPHLPIRIPLSPLPAELRAISILLLGCCMSTGCPTGAASKCTTAERWSLSPTWPVLGHGSSPEGGWGGEPATVLTITPCARWQRAPCPLRPPQTEGEC